MNKVSRHVEIPCINTIDEIIGTDDQVIKRGVPPIRKDKNVRTIKN